jgi:transcriptional regulator with XRE-family HTH domain
MSKRKGCIGIGMVPGEMALGNFVRKRRLELGLSQVELGNQTKYFKCISDVETGKRYCYDLKYYQLEELAKVLQCDLDELRKLVPDRFFSKTELGKIIYSRRKELNMSIEEFARRMNITLQKAKSIERHRKSIDGDLIILLSEVLNLEAQVLVKFKKKSPESKLGQLIRKRRKELGLSGSDLARRLDVAKQTVNQIEFGKSPLNSSDGMIEKLAEILKIDASELLAVRNKRKIKKANTPNPLIEFLVNKRIELHFTQQQVIKLSGLATSYVCSIEKGRIKPCLGALGKIARALGDCQIPPELIIQDYVILEVEEEKNTALGRFIKEKRIELGLKRKHIIKKTSLSYGVVLGIESGSYSPTLKTLEKISKALKCEIPDELIVSLKKKNKHGNLGAKTKRETELGNLLTSQRLMQELTQAQVAKMAGLSSCVISKIERGNYSTKPMTLKKIVSALNFKIDP